MGEFERCFQALISFSTNLTSFTIEAVIHIEYNNPIQFQQSLLNTSLKNSNTPGQFSLQLATR